jgi:DNA uptake protein ComE-like DNA-binding protein
LADFILAYRLYGAYTPQAGGATGGGAPGTGGPGGGNNSTTNIVTNSASPVQKAQIDLTKQPQSIPSIFALVNARVGISQTTQSITQRVTRGPGGSTTVVVQQNTTIRTTVYTSPLADQSKLQQYLPILLDKFSTRKDTEIPARINVNTAPQAVLSALPGLDDTDVQNIVTNQPPAGTGSSDPNYQTPAWLLTQAKLTPTKLQAVERYITARPQVFRVQSLGYFEQSGPVARIEAVIDTNAGQPRIVYWRDITELGKGFDIQK